MRDGESGSEIVFDMSDEDQITVIVAMDYNQITTLANLRRIGMSTRSPPVTYPVAAKWPLPMRAFTTDACLHYGCNGFFKYLYSTWSKNLDRLC